jgi:hypothetical protein
LGGFAKIFSKGKLVVFDKNTITRTIQLALRKSVLGVIIGIGTGFAFGVLESSIEWLFRPPFDPSLTRIWFRTQSHILANVLFIGIPIAAVIGFVMGLCSPAYKNRRFPHLLWQGMVSISVITAFLVSGFNEISQARFILLVLTVSFIASWLIYRSILQELYTPKWSKTPIADTLYSISGLIMLFVVTYLYFRFQFSLWSVSS